MNFDMEKLSLLEYQCRLDNRFGKGIVKALSYNGSVSSHDHIVRLPGKKKVTITRKPRWFYESSMENLNAAVLGAEENRARAIQCTRNTIQDYQKQLDKRYGKGNVLALEYRNARTPVRHLVNELTVTVTPDKMMHQHRTLSHLICHVNGITTYVGSCNAEQFSNNVASVSNGTISCVEKYKGVRNVHKFHCSVCNNDFSRLLLSAKAIGLTCPVCEPRSCKFSKVALSWLAHIGRRYRIRIRNAKSKLGEKQFNLKGVTYRVDGFSERHGIIFEFYGDLWHGNKEYGSTRKFSHPFRNLSDRELYNETMRREEKLRNLGFNVLSIWGSEFKDKEKFRIWLRDADSKMRKWIAKWN